MNHRTKEEYYRYLSVDIDSSDPAQQPTVQGCVEQFFQPEDRELKCEKCEEGTAATQTLQILSRPRAVLVHLKRFVLVESKDDSGKTTVAFQKNRAAVALDGTLSLAPHWKTSATAASAPSPSYALQSVVHHIGNTADSGHYTADCLRRSVEDGSPQWVSYDDALTAETTLGKVQGSVQNKRAAYMLLYSMS